MLFRGKNREEAGQPTLFEQADSFFEPADAFIAPVVIAQYERGLPGVIDEKTCTIEELIERSNNMAHPFPRLLVRYTDHTFNKFYLDRHYINTGDNPSRLQKIAQDSLNRQIDSDPTILEDDRSIERARQVAYEEGGSHLARESLGIALQTFEPKVQTAIATEIMKRVDRAALTLPDQLFEKFRDALTRYGEDDPAKAWGLSQKLLQRYYDVDKQRKSTTAPKERFAAVYDAVGKASESHEIKGSFNGMLVSETLGALKYHEVVARFQRDVEGIPRSRANEETANLVAHKHRPLFIALQKPMPGLSITTSASPLAQGLETSKHVARETGVVARELGLATVEAVKDVPVDAIAKTGRVASVSALAAALGFGGLLHPQSAKAAELNATMTSQITKAPTSTSLASDMLSVDSLIAPQTQQPVDKLAVNLDSLDLQLTAPVEDRVVGDKPTPNTPIALLKTASDVIVKSSPNQTKEKDTSHESSHTEMLQKAVSLAAQKHGWSANKRKFISALIKHGAPLAPAAGIGGSAKAESGYRPCVEEMGNNIGFSIMQWSFGRRTMFEKALKENDTNCKDIDYIAEYTILESQHRTQRDGSGNEWEGLYGIKDPQAAARYWQYNFERPRSVSIQSVRTREAQAIYSEVMAQLNALEHPVVAPRPHPSPAAAAHLISQERETLLTADDFIGQIALLPTSYPSTSNNETSTPTAQNGNPPSATTATPDTTPAPNSPATGSPDVTSPTPEASNPQNNDPTVTPSTTPEQATGGNIPTPSQDALAATAIDLSGISLDTAGPDEQGSSPDVSLLATASDTPPAKAIEKAAASSANAAENNNNTIQQRRQAEINALRKSGNFKGSQALDHAPRTPLEKKLAEQGQQNGRLKNVERLGDKWGDASLYAPAAEAFRKMNAAFRAARGHDLVVNDSYRNYEGQVAAKADATAKGRPLFAATPGKSKHGWGLALDLGGGMQSFDSGDYKWMKANAIKFGFNHPDFADDANTREPWHWEYVLSE
jgi:LAS superfamily LD-carboxypeptidase LdcB